MMLPIMQQKIYSILDKDKYWPKYTEYKTARYGGEFFCVASFYYTILGEQLCHIYQVM
jgi:hypothetical protein